jgi:signal transduction histidine kinase
MAHVSLRLALAAVLVCSSARAFALDPTKALPDYTIDVWRLRDGLPGSWVRDVAQSADGYLWTATLGGVGRYDGARVARISAERPFERASDTIAVFEGPEGAMWVVPSNGDPVCVRGEAVFECFPQGQRLPAGSRLLAAHRDAEGTVWLVARDGLYQWSGGRLTAVRGADRLPLERATAVLRDRRGRLWVGSLDGLFVKQGDAFLVHAGPGGAFTRSVSGIFETPGGRLWIAGAGAGRLLRIEGAETTVYTEADGLPHVRQRQILEDRDGNVWIASDDGLIRFRPVPSPPERRFIVYGEGDGLPDRRVLALFEDREGSLWVGTRAAGLAQLTDRTLRTGAGPASLRDRPLESLSQAGDGALWFGTRSGVVRWKDGEERRYTREDGLPSNRVQAVVPGRNGEVWLGTQHGLARWRAGGVDVVPGAEENILSLYLDDAGTLWAGGENRVLSVRDGQVGVLLPAPGVSPGDIRGLAHDDQGTLWVAGDNQLARASQGRIVAVDPADGGPLRAARAVHRDAQGTLWFGTAGSGLVRRSQGRFRAFGAAEGVTPDQLYQVIADDHGHLWMGTTRGVLRVSLAELDEVAAGRRSRVDLVSFEAFDRRRDVSATGTRQPGAWKTHDGGIWFATDQGALVIDPRRRRENPLAPPVIVEKALVDGRLARRDASNVFAPGPGNLEFHFGGTTLLEPHKVLHRYRLEGFDPDWIEAGARRVAYYTNIAPGAYRFRVQARNGDGVWNEAGDSVAFQVRPHFYRTPWFYGLCGLALLSLAFAAHRVRVMRLRREYLAVFAERSRVARELHDTLLQGMSAVSMQLHALRAQVKGDDGGLARKLEAIEDVVSTSLEDTRRYVWNLREQPTGEGDLGVALKRLARRVLEGRSLACEVHVEGEVAPHLPHDLQDELFRITQEALANVLKHAQASRVDVRLRYERAGLRLTVTDDGRGFEPGRAHGSAEGHFGLIGMRERATRIGASLDVESRPGAGTTILVTVPTTTFGEAHV